MWAKVLITLQHHFIRQLDSSNGDCAIIRYMIAIAIDYFDRLAHNLPVLDVSVISEELLDVHLKTVEREARTLEAAA